jgi:hypothetical protein
LFGLIESVDDKTGEQFANDQLLCGADSSSKELLLTRFADSAAFAQSELPVKSMPYIADEASPEGVLTLIFKTAVSLAKTGVATESTSKTEIKKEIAFFIK